MHVLHLETGRHLYGGALQVLYLMNGLREYACQNTLVCARGSEISRAAAKAARVIYAVPMAGELDPRCLLRFCQIIRNERPDIVHVHSRRGADLWGGLAAHAARRKAILTRRVDNPERRLIVAAKYRLYDKVIAISEGIRQVLLQEGVPANKVDCVPSAVDSQHYQHPCQREWFCEQFGLRPDNKAIGVIAQLIPRKGHRYLIEAAPEILKRYPETRFLFFGQGPLQQDLQQLCKRANIANKVHFAAFRADLERILPCLDMVVHPATMEGLGVSLLQAAAAGVPIVATRVGGIPEIIRDRVNGHLVDVGDSEALIHGVLTLLGNPAKAKYYANNGQERVSSEFSIKKMVTGNVAVYQEVLAS
jgi:glycosyltransferase involved in cell wall biosynthesis